MKRIFLAGAVFFCSYTVIGQNTSAGVRDTVPSSDTAHHWDKKMNAYITMQAGQLIVVKGDKTAKLDKDWTLKNGTIVMADGTVKTSDGMTMPLKEGDKVYFDGTIVKGSKDPQ